MFIGRPKYLSFVIVIGSILFFGWYVQAFEMDFHGELSGWANRIRIQDEWENSAGLLYIPQADFEYGLDDDSSLDAEFSIYCFALTGSGPYEEDIDLEIYRANIRYNTNQTETCAGLQKINFGQATLLRPLRWFDRMDPADPLQLTEGVYALRYRYSAINSANFWIWVLYGNDDIKGYELLPSESDKIEAGGRFQYPIFYGDLAATFHTRKVNGSDYEISDFRENRFGLDGRWDMIMGLWFETSFEQQKTDYFYNDWTKRGTMGLDYTFDMGNGLYSLIEHMIISPSDEAFEWYETYNISAFSINYPIGVLDSVKAIGYYDWEQDSYYQYMDWTRTYDSVMINVSLFYNPKERSGNGGIGESRGFSGSGGQILISFNH